MKHYIIKLLAFKLHTEIKSVSFTQNKTFIMPFHRELRFLLGKTCIETIGTIYEEETSIWFLVSFLYQTASSYTLKLITFSYDEKLHKVSPADRMSELIAVAENTTMSYRTFSSVFVKQVTNTFKDFSRLKYFYSVTKQSESEQRRRPVGMFQVKIFTAVNDSKYSTFK